MGVFHSDISISICQRKLSKILILLSVVSGRSACGDGQSHDFIGNGDSHPLCGFLLLLLQRTARLLRSTCNLRLLSASSCKWLSTCHGDAGILPTVPTPPYSMPQTIQPSHAVTIPSSHQASAPAPEAPLPSSPAELPSPAPGSLSFRQLEARVDTLYSIANSASDVVVACRNDTDGTQHWIGNECKFPNSLLRDLNWQMICKQYFFHIHSLCCNTPIQFSFLQSWDICAAAEPIMLSLLCEDSYAIKILQKKFQQSVNVNQDCGVE